MQPKVHWNVEKNKRLVKRMRDAFGADEAVLYISNRDVIAILPTVVRLVFNTAIIGAIAWSVAPIYAGTISRVLIVALIFLWVRFSVGSYLNYSFEILAVTKNTTSGDTQVWYRRNFWLRKITPVKASSIVSASVNQSRAFYQTLLGVGDVPLDAYGDESDIAWRDCGDPYELRRLIQVESSRK